MRRARVTATLAVAIVALSLPSSSDADRAQPVAQSFAPPGAAAPQTGSSGGPSLAERNTADQPDTGSHLTHVVYFVPKGEPDEGLDTNGTITNSVRSVRSWFVRETGNLRPRVDALAAGGFDITFVGGSKDASEYSSLDRIVADLKAARLNDPSKRYLIYAAVNRDGVCGESYYPLPAADERGQYAAIYLNSRAQCGARNFGDGTYATAGKAETIAAHEWLHNEGVAPIGAPHYCASTLYHVCTGALWLMPEMDPEANDIVFPYITDVLGRMVLDRDRDDYLDHEWPWLPNLRQSAWLESV